MLHTLDLDQVQAPPDFTAMARAQRVIGDRSPANLVAA